MRKQNNVSIARWKNGCPGLEGLYEQDQKPELISDAEDLTSPRGNRIRHGLIAGMTKGFGDRILNDKNISVVSIE